MKITVTSVEHETQSITFDSSYKTERLSGMSEIKALVELENNVQLKVELAVSTRDIKRMTFEEIGEYLKGKIVGANAKEKNVLQYILDQEDAQKVAEAVERSPLGSKDLGEISRLSGLLQHNGIDVASNLFILCKKYNIDTYQRWAGDGDK